MTRLVIIAAILAISAQAFAVQGLTPVPRPKEPHTTFQTGWPYRPEHDIRTDAVIHYNCGKEGIQSWKDKGYVVQTMYGFRTGDDYIKDHRDEGQTMANGEILTCGPGSYYMVPTQARIDAALDYFRKAIDGGSSAAFPEEPEFFTQTGYSDAFKKEWQAYYGEPWQDQTTSIEARWKSSRLKAFLEYRMIRSIAEDAQKQNPKVVRGVAAHSAVSYYNWGIIYPHYQVMRLPGLQEMIGQVWTGTARSACRYNGEVAERTFENGFLEYSSLYNLMRGTGKRLWFLMDPLEDNPDRSMEDYQSNYVKTLVASLMFPGVDEYEVMPWPDRIFGRVPGDFATKIMTVVTMLGDMHNQKTAYFDGGTQGIATFVADSMGWQRGAPNRSNFDCFYGLTLPLVMKGIPVQVAQLERTPEPKYLDPYKVLLLSYDIMKPMDRSYNTAIAQWVKSGGALVLFGGTDAYNEVPEWWTKAGFESPQDDLLKQLGVKFTGRQSLPTEDENYRVLAREEKPVRDGTNRKQYTFEVQDYVLQGDSLFIKFADSQVDDGYGPLVFHVELKIDGQTIASFDPGTPEEKRHLDFDNGSQLNGNTRFADAGASWVYWFEVPSRKAMFGSKVELILDMANQFQVSAATAGPSYGYKWRTAKDTSISAKYPRFNMSRATQITAYDVADVTRLYSLEYMGSSAFFEKKVGKGTVIFCGITPSLFASSEGAGNIYRAIVQYACEKAGIPYKEQHYMKVRRGRYVAVRAIDKPVKLQGSFIDVLDPGLALIKNPQVKSGELGVYADVAQLMADKKPRMLLSSSRLEAYSETPTQTRLRLSGPLNTRSAVRISTAGRKVKSVSVQDPSGKAMPFDQKPSQGTLLITHDGLPDGVLVQVTWQ